MTGDVLSPLESQYIKSSVPRSPSLGSPEFGLGGGAEHRRSVAEVSMFSVLCSEWLQWVVEKRRWEKMGGSVLKDTQRAPE